MFLGSVSSVFAACDVSANADKATYALIATFHVKDGQADRFMTAMKKNIAASRKEPGVVAYLSYRSETDPNVFLNFESYVDKNAFKAHVDSAHVKEVNKVNDEILAKPLDLLMLVPYWETL